MVYLEPMPHVFGWCFGQEECANCRVLYRDWNNIVQECSCECHVGKEKPPTPPEVEVTVGGKKRRGAGPSTYAKKRAKVSAVVQDTDVAEEASSPPEAESESSSLDSL